MPFLLNSVLTFLLSSTLVFEVHFALFLTLAICLLPASNVQELGVMSETTSSSRLLDGSSEFVLTYEDKDGDWMLVGDVPWEYVLHLLPCSSSCTMTTKIRFYKMCCKKSTDTSYFMSEPLFSHSAQYITRGLFPA